MRNSSRTPIDEVAIDAAGAVAIRPRIAADETFEHIYRAAMGVRWHSDTRSLVPYETKGETPAWWFRQIVAAVSSEYGQLLELQPDTKWTNVSSDVRRAIEAIEDGHAV